MGLKLVVCLNQNASHEQIIFTFVA